MFGIDRSRLSRVENGTTAISRPTDRLVRTPAVVHDPPLVQKLKRLGRREEVLGRLGEIGSDKNPIEMQLDHAKDGSTYDRKAAA
jgi:hypothetical protein